MQPEQQHATGTANNSESVPAWVRLINDKLDTAIRKAAYKYMLPEEEVRKIVML